MSFRERLSERLPLVPGVHPALSAFKLDDLSLESLRKILVQKSSFQLCHVQNHILNAFFADESDVPSDGNVTLQQ